MCATSGVRGRGKESFWRQLDEEIEAIPQVIIGGDLNGHVGKGRAALSRIHGDWGIGKNAEKISIGK